jgi:superfamily II DNA or RNA helicase
LELFGWQAECLDIWVQNGCRGIVSAVTGSGKTILALAAFQKLKTAIDQELRVKIVVPQTFLAYQWREEIRRNLKASSTEIGLYYGKRKDTGRKYAIYVVNSARYSLARHLMFDLTSGYAVLLVADECHHYGSPENNTFLISTKKLA